MGSPTPFGPLAQVRLWGRPWHGRMDHNPLADPFGTWRVVLPNGAVKMLKPIGELQSHIGDMPTGIRVGFRPYSGENALFERADVGPLARSPAQLAEDAAAGKQWLHRAIMHRPAALGGVPNWVWVDGSGMRWLVTAWFRSDGLLRVFLRRFGYFGDRYDPDFVIVRDIAYTAESVGQAAPAFPASSPDSESLLNYATHDVSKTGDKAIIRISIDGGAFASGNQTIPLVRNGIADGTHIHFAPALPVGWLELSMSGTPESGAWAISISVLADRATTIGARTVTHTADYEDRAHLGATTAVPAYIWEIETGLVADQVHSPTPEDVLRSEITSGISLYTLYRRGSETYTVSIGGAVLSMHYESGAIVTLSADFEWVSSYAVDSAFSYSGTDVWHYARASEGDAWVLSGRDMGIERTCTFTGAAELHETWTLKRDGLVVSEWSSGVSETRVSSADWRHAFLPGADAPHWVLVSDSVTGGATFETCGDTHTWPAELDGALQIYGRGGSQSFFAEVFSEVRTLTDTAVLWSPVICPYVVGIYGVPFVATDTAARWRRCFVGYAHNCAGYIAYAGESAADTVLRIGEITTPSGIEPAIAPTAYNASARPLAFCSYNPITGQLGRSDWPVNWI